MTRYLLQLMLTRGIGDKALKKILAYTTHTGKDLQSVFEDAGVLSQLMGRRTGIQEMLESLNANESAAVEMARRLEAAGVAVITENDTAYPQRLKTSLRDDCPPVLFVRGNARLLSEPAVGFCGSRKVSQKGEHITEQCAEQLAERGITVVSGYASGTDLAAHSSAIRHGGSTVFVLAEGILNAREKQPVRPWLTEENHVFVSQFFPTAQWNVGSAMKRNGLIIGLSDAMILVESGKTGGTFAAGQETLQRGKPLFVIDFEKPEVSAEANPFFIERGGNPIRGINGIPNLKKVFSTLRSGSTVSIPEQIGMEQFVHMA